MSNRRFFEELKFAWLCRSSRRTSSTFSTINSRARNNSRINSNTLREAPAIELQSFSLNKTAF